MALGYDVEYVVIHTMFLCVTKIIIAIATIQQQNETKSRIYTITKLPNVLHRVCSQAVCLLGLENICVYVRCACA